MFIRQAHASFRALPVIALAVAGLMSQPVFAHAHLKTQTPAADSVVSAAPSSLVLKFSEGVELKFSGVTVTGPSHAAVATGALQLDPHDDTLVTVPLTSTLLPGQYQVEWHVVATDSHKTHGTYRFTVKP